MSKWRDSEIYKLEVEFEAFVRATVTRRTYIRYTNTIYDFLSAFPKKLRPEEFYACDVADWAGQRELTRSHSTVNSELREIRYFFNWLILQKGYSIPNPASPRKRIRSHREPKTVSVAQLEHLLSVAQGLDIEILKRIAAGESLLEIAQSLDRQAGSIRKRVRRLIKLAELELNLKELREAIPRLYMRLGRDALIAQLSLSSPQSFVVSSTL